MCSLPRGLQRKTGRPKAPRANFECDYTNLPRIQRLRLGYLFTGIFTFKGGFGLLGDGEGAHALLPRDGLVGGQHGQAAFGALIGAAAALDAAEVVDGPGTGLLVNLDGTARAALDAQAAQDAGGLVDRHMTFQTRGRLGFHHGVQHGLGLLEKRAERHFSKFESAHRSTFPCS